LAAESVLVLGYELEKKSTVRLVCRVLRARERAHEKKKLPYIEKLFVVRSVFFARERSRAIKKILCLCCVSCVARARASARKNKKSTVNKEVVCRVRFVSVRASERTKKISYDTSRYVEHCALCFFTEVMSFTVHMVYFFRGWKCKKYQ